jgi:hypothetical protein
MPILLATLEAEIGRIVIQGQPREIVSRTPSQPIKKLSIVACTSHSSYVGSINRRIEVQVGLNIKVRPYLNITKANKSGSMAAFSSPCPKSARS